MAANVERTYGDHTPKDGVGAQRLSVERMKRWQQLEYGMFVHFGLASYNQNLAEIMPSDYQPPGPVDTDQWAQVARDAGMKYIIFTAQHCNSFTMWHTKMDGVTHVGQSSQPDDVVASFVASCRRYDIVPALYYSQSRFTPWAGDGSRCQLPSRAALDSVKCQPTELLTQYGAIGELWLDGPQKYGDSGRYELYEHIATLQPDIVIAYNGWGEDIIRKPRFHESDCGWPSDVMVLEVMLPPFAETDAWRPMTIDNRGTAGEFDMYVPVESCCVIERNFVDWFYDPDAELISDSELLGMRLVAKARNANLVLNVTPGPDTRIPDAQVSALMRLGKNYDTVNTAIEQ